MQEEQDAAAAAGQEPALFGAKITGGGCGGERLLAPWPPFPPIVLARAGGCGVLPLLTEPAAFCSPPLPNAGTVGILAVAGPAGEAAVARVVVRYAQESGTQPTVFQGSSAGAATFGHLRLRWRAAGG